VSPEGCEEVREEWAVRRHGGLLYGGSLGRVGDRA